MRIIGIDWGSTGIKAVELDSVFSRFEIHEYYEKKFSGADDPKAVLQQFILGLAKQPDYIAISIPSGKITFRAFHLPTKDKRAIQAAIGFELEDELPFSVENSAFDYTIVGQDKTGTNVHVAATLKKHLEEALTQWTSCSVDPDIVTSEAWALRTFLNKALSPPDREQPVMLILIGHERTTIYIHYQSHPVLARELNWGGRDLTQAICQKYSISLEKAESAKLEHGFVLTDQQREAATQEQVQFSETLMAPIQDLIWNIKQSGLACRNIEHEKISKIYLSGSTSALPGLDRVIEEQIGLRVKLLPALSSLTTSGVSYPPQADQSMLLASALALTVTGTERTTCINLRKKQYSKQGQAQGINLGQFRKPIIAAAAVWICTFASLMTQSLIYQGRIEQKDVDLRRAVKSFFSIQTESAVKSYLASTSKLKKDVTTELNKQRDLSKLAGANPHSPIDFLKELSTSIGKETVVDLIQFQAGAASQASYSSAEAGNTTLTFLLASQQSAEKIASTLEGKFSSGAQKTKLEEAAGIEPGQKRWKITFSGKLNEGAYGN
ncbi:MAG: type II secretion system protein GspL [Bdellovibrionota bacterium]